MEIAVSILFIFWISPFNQFVLCYYWVNFFIVGNDILIAHPNMPFKFDC